MDGHTTCWKCLLEIPYSSGNYDEWVRHIGYCKTYSCPKCERKYKTNRSRKRHIHDIHEEKESKKKKSKSNKTQRKKAGLSSIVEKMANIASSTTKHAKSNGSNSPTTGVTNLHEIYSFLEEPTCSLNLSPGAGPYDRIVAMIRHLDLQDDGIAMNQKIKAIEADFCTNVKDEHMLCESMNFINEKALEDGEIALKFALLFSSRNFDALAMKETKVRSAMLKILETNFLNADTFRVHDKERLYNSITLLGEYYNRVRLADNSPITILGESLIGLLIREIQGQEVIDSKLAKLILSQMTLNGDIMRARHQSDITQLLFHIRRNLVEQTKLSSTVKALLLMTLDLYYRNFANLGTELETFYTKYLVHEEQEDKGNNNKNRNTPNKQHKNPSQQKDEDNTTPQKFVQEPEVADSNNDSFEIPPLTKKWSEQVCEDSMYETDALPDYEDNNQSDTTNDQINSNSFDHKRNPSLDSGFVNRRRPHGQRSPRPFKPLNDKRGSHEFLAPAPVPNVNGEEADQTKPLPRWRATRFNREEEQHNDSRNRYRRFSGSFDDDQSVRSEGGSIRLYSINDRLKHSQEKMERSNNNYSFMVNSNWDRQSQRDDRSERSYISNYEYGSKQRRGYRNYNNRQTYDKPPRFQKNRKPQQQQQQSPEEPQKPYAENWRRSRANSSNSCHEDNDEARASTLPRPAKTNLDGSIKSASFRRSQSPTHQREFNRNHQQRGTPRHYNGRFGSQNSIHSEDALPSEEQRQPQHHQQQQRHNNRGGRRYNVNPRRQQKPSQEDQTENWDPKQPNPDGGQKENSELVRNARQTTEYMNYLSSQK